MPWYYGHPELVQAAKVKGDRQLGALGLLAGAAGKGLALYKQQRDEDRALNDQITSLKAMVGDDNSTPETSTTSTPLAQGQPTTGFSETNLQTGETSWIRPPGTPATPAEEPGPIGSTQPSGMHPAGSAAPEKTGTSSSVLAKLAQFGTRAADVGRSISSFVEPVTQPLVNAASSVAARAPTVAGRIGETLGVETEGRTAKRQQLAQLLGVKARDDMELKHVNALSNLALRAVNPGALLQGAAPHMLRNIPSAAFQTREPGLKLTWVDIADRAAHGDPIAKQTWDAYLASRKTGATGSGYRDAKVDSAISWLDKHGYDSSDPEQVAYILKKFGTGDSAEDLRTIGKMAGLDMGEPGEEANPLRPPASKGFQGGPTTPARKIDPNDPLFEEAAAAGQLDPSLLRGVVEQESGFDPSAVNPDSGATGLGQFLPTTWSQAKEWGGDPTGNPKDPRANLFNIAHYLRYLIDKNGGNVREALRQYGGVVKNNLTYPDEVIAKQERYQGKNYSTRPESQRAIRSTTGYDLGVGG